MKTYIMLIVFGMIIGIIVTLLNPLINSPTEIDIENVPENLGWTEIVSEPYTWLIDSTVNPVTREVLMDSAEVTFFTEAYYKYDNYIWIKHKEITGDTIIILPDGTVCIRISESIKEK